MLGTPDSVSISFMYGKSKEKGIAELQQEEDTPDALCSSRYVILSPPAVRTNASRDSDALGIAVGERLYRIALHGHQHSK
jgi:hypothetical protein